MNTAIVRQKHSLGQRINISLQKYLSVLRVSIANNLAYMMEVVLRSLFLIIFIYIFLQLWTVTFAAKGIHSLGGFRITDLVWYLAATETIALSLPQLTRLIDQEVRSGQLAYLLSRPCSYLLYHYAQYLGERFVRFILNSCVAFIITFVIVGPPPFTLFGLLAWPLVVFFAISIEFVVYFSTGLLAFWTEETAPFSLIINRLALIMGGVLAPLEILPQPIRSIAQVLPFSAVYYGPARTLIHFDANQLMGLLVQQIITLAVGSIVLLIIYQVAIRRVNINGG